MKKVLAIVGSLVLALVLFGCGQTTVQEVNAEEERLTVQGASSQPLEYLSGVNGTYTWNLRYRGYGFTLGSAKGACDNLDYVFDVLNKVQSVDSDKMRLNSSNTQVNSAFSGKSPIGHALNGAYPYICIGTTTTINAGGATNIVNHLKLKFVP